MPVVYLGLAGERHEGERLGDGRLIVPSRKGMHSGCREALLWRFYGHGEMPCRLGHSGFCHALQSPLPSLPPISSAGTLADLVSGFDKCKPQRQALERYLEAAEAFGPQATSGQAWALRQRQQRAEEAVAAAAQERQR